MNLLIATEQVSRDLEEHYKLLQELGGWPETDEPARLSPAPEPEQEPVPDWDWEEEPEDPVRLELLFLARKVSNALWGLASLYEKLPPDQWEELHRWLSLLADASAEIAWFWDKYLAQNQE